MGQNILDISEGKKKNQERNRHDLGMQETISLPYPYDLVTRFMRVCAPISEQK